jgi:hypothetical protein
MARYVLTLGSEGNLRAVTLKAFPEQTYRTIIAELGLGQTPDACVGFGQASLFSTLGNGHEATLGKWARPCPTRAILMVPFGHFGGFTRSPRRLLIEHFRRCCADGPGQRAGAS